MSRFALGFGSTWIGAGVFIVAVAMLQILGRVPPYSWCGIRIKAALESEDAWYRINRHGGKSFLAYGCAVACVGVAALFVLPFDSPPFVRLGLVVLPGLLMIPTVIHLFRFPGK